MSSANPLWGAPRIHGELLKLGIAVSQATVAKYMVRRRGTPSQNWRTFLRNHAEGIAAIDMFVVASASFHSTISRVTLMFFRAATALRIVRIDFAVRPCLPITLPKSSFATRNSSSVAASPRVSVTSTASGLLTSCRAKNRTSSFMAGSVEEVEVKFFTSRHDRA
jgi:hypothetical protein